MFEHTSEPLSAAVQCYDKHHARNDFDQLRLDEVEETLCQVDCLPCAFLLITVRGSNCSIV